MLIGSVAQVEEELSAVGACIVCCNFTGAGLANSIEEDSFNFHSKEIRSNIIFTTKSPLGNLESDLNKILILFRFFFWV